MAAPVATAKLARTPSNALIDASPRERCEERLGRSSFRRTKTLQHLDARDLGAGRDFRLRQEEVPSRRPLPEQVNEDGRVEKGQRRLAW